MIQIFSADHEYFIVYARMQCLAISDGQAIVIPSHLSVTSIYRWVCLAIDVPDYLLRSVAPFLTIPNLGADQIEHCYQWRSEL